MLTYQVRERTFWVQRNLDFPNDVEMRFVFHPDTAFGNAGAKGISHTPSRLWDRIGTTLLDDKGEAGLLSRPHIRVRFWVTKWHVVPRPAHPRL